jgi:hypothetical protein
MSVKLHFDWHKGLGTQLCAFSTFVNSSIDTLFVPGDPQHHEFSKYKKIFNVDDSQLDLKSYEYIEQTIDPRSLIEPQDLFKLYSSYVVKEKLVKTRKFVGLACYHDSDFMFDCTNMNTDYPYNKLYPIEIYQKLFKLIKSWGYDVITIDARDTQTEDKADIIYNMCDFVIGYEGGIAHLAHMLDTPTFILPWRTGSLLPELLHLDKKTYFCQSVNEIMSWSTIDLNEQLIKLNRKETNNRFLTNQLHLINNNFSFSLPGVTEFNPTLLGFDEIHYVKNFCQPLKLGGF